MQLHKRICIGFFVILAISGLRLGFAATESMANLFHMEEVVVTGTKTERRLMAIRIGPTLRGLNIN